MEEPVVLLGEDMLEPVLEPEVPRVELLWSRLEEPLVEAPERVVSEEEPEVPEVEEPVEPD